MDPLSVLRDYTVQRKLDQIVRVGDEFRFGSEYAFPCSTDTAYRSKQGSLYTLETLLFFVRHHNIKHTDYLQSARSLRLLAVTLPDRKPLLDYLLGHTSSADAIEFLPPSAAAPDVEEYRPDDPSFLPSAAAAHQSHLADAARVPDDRRSVDYMAMIRTLERPLKDREALLQCRNRDFYGVLVASTRREEERQRLESQQRKDGLVAKTRLIGTDDRAGGDDLDGAAPKPKMHLKGSKIGEGVPIILVPSASQTLITIYNVKEFLEDGVFVATDVKMKAMRGVRPDCVTVQKKLSRERAVAAYEVRDKPSTLKPEDWDRVVAVFVLGKEWQFKDWPFKDHVEIFNKTPVIGWKTQQHYLGLRRTLVKELPRSLGRLRNLRTLDLNDSKIEKLPHGITQLKNLRHLFAWSIHDRAFAELASNPGVKAPKGIWNLKNLQALVSVEADEDIVRHIGNLIQLRTLRITRVRGMHSVELCSSISKMSHLVNLDITTSNEGEALQLEALNPPSFLYQKLELRGQLENGVLPHWFSSLAGLRQLGLSWSRLREDPLPCLHALPNLAILGMYNAYDGQELRFHAGGFPKLKFLMLGGSNRLDSISIEEGALPSLSELSLLRCRGMNLLPQGIEHLTSLQILYLVAMPLEFIDRMRGGNGNMEERQKVQHIPLIKHVFQSGEKWTAETLS